MKQYFLADYRRAMTCRPHLVEIVLMAVSVILKEYGYSQQLPQYHRPLNSH